MYFINGPPVFSILGEHEAHTRAVKAGTVLLFLVYPTVSSTVFQGIACVQLDADEWWLAADMQTACVGGTSPMLLQCTIASLLIPIGLPIAVGLRLYTQREQLQTMGSEERERFAFFCKDYELKFYYWECVEMVRKVVMCGFLSFFGRGSVTQLAVGVLWTLLFMVAVTHTRPFVADFADALKAAVDCAVLITLVLAMLLKTDLSGELFDANQVAIAMLAANLLLPCGVVLW